MLEHCLTLASAGAMHEALGFRAASQVRRLQLGPLCCACCCTRMPQPHAQYTAALGSPSAWGDLNKRARRAAAACCSSTGGQSSVWALQDWTGVLFSLWLLPLPYLSCCTPCLSLQEQDCSACQTPAITSCTCLTSSLTCACTAWTGVVCGASAQTLHCLINALPVPAGPGLECSALLQLQWGGLLA